MKNTKRSIFRLALPALAPVMVSGAIACDASAQLIPGDPEVPAAKIRLIAQHGSIAAGSETWLGVEFDIAPKWHIYWPGQNDSGFAPRFEWTLPEGVSVGEIQWPGPHRYILPGSIMDHTYEGRVVVLAKLTTASDFTSDEPVAVRARVEWLECEEGCVPREGDVRIMLPVSGETPAPSAEAEIISKAMTKLPKPSGDQVRVEWGDAKRVTLTPALPTGLRPSRIAFYPHESGIEVVNPLKNAEAKAGSLTLPLKPSDGAQDQRLIGVLECWDDAGATLGLWEISVPTGQGVPAGAR